MNNLAEDDDVVLDSLETIKYQPEKTDLHLKLKVRIPNVVWMRVRAYSPYVGIKEEIWLFSKGEGQLISWQFIVLYSWTNRAKW